jgi:hypothetical protein
MNTVRTPVERPVEASVLEDVTGRRARWLRRAARAISLLFLIWLLVIVLGGFGLIPAGRLPLTSVLRASTGPPPLRTLPTPQPPSPADLRPARAAPVALAASAPAPTRSRRKPAAHHGRSAAKPGRAKPNAHAHRVPPGRSKAITSHGHSQLSPGHVRRQTTTTATATATAPGSSAAAPGRAKHP